jgi:hypothetical protein
MEVNLIDKKIEDNELLNDVKLLNLIVNDLNNCIKDQGEKLDLIENNLTMTEDIIDKSNEKLGKANYYKKEIQKKYLTLAGIASVVIYLLIL